VFAPEAGQPAIHLAHVGNSSIWLQRTAACVVELLSKAHAIDKGMLLRAVGLSQDVVPDINRAAVEPGDRVFLTTAGPAFSFTPETLGAIALAHSGESLDDCAAALAEFAKSSGSPEGITVLAAEVARSAMFWAP
jgi:serine/threonine protein phosphatase PrpC